MNFPREEMGQAGTNLEDRGEKRETPMRMRYKRDLDACLGDAVLFSVGKHFASIGWFNTRDTILPFTLHSGESRRASIL